MASKYRLFFDLLNGNLFSIFIHINSGVDVVPPTINCTDDIHTTAASGSPGTTVTWTRPTATDNSGRATLISETHTPGRFFNVGATSVTYTFQDPSGNAATCTFIVTVTSQGLFFEVDVWYTYKWPVFEEKNAYFHFHYQSDITNYNCQ